ncbi:ABC transporter permease [Salmonella enterica]|nr:ABC transporter permease [Salmonella enterica]
MFKLALLDIYGGLKKIQFWNYMAWQEIIIRYRRSVLGPFWITASTAIYVVSISIVFSTLFSQDIKHYLLYLSLGFLIWNYINQTVIESADSFIACASFIKQIRIERSVFIYQSIIRNVYFFLHNALILVVCLIFSDSTCTFYAISKALFGFSILTINLFFLSLTLACLCTRFMDLRQIVMSVLQIGFLVTPIMWIPTESMHSKAFLLEWNPLFHFIDFIRSPLLPVDFPTAFIHPSIVYITVFSIINICAGFLIFAKSRKNISYWV